MKTKRLPTKREEPVEMVVEGGRQLAAAVRCVGGSKAPTVIVCHHSAGITTYRFPEGLTDKRAAEIASRVKPAAFK